MYTFMRCIRLVDCFSGEGGWGIVCFCADDEYTREVGRQTQHRPTHCNTQGHNRVTNVLLGILEIYAVVVLLSSIFPVIV